MSKRVFIFAAEASSDIIGQAMVLEFIKSGYSVVGIGPRKMQKAGMISLIENPYDIGIIGLFEAIPYLLKIRKCYKLALAEVKTGYNIFVSIDIPKLAKPLAKQAKLMSIPTYHVVSPTIWAWRYERIWQFKQLFKTIYCLFPFELPYYKEIGMRAVFIGSPLLRSDNKRPKAKRAQLKRTIEKKCINIDLFPGSRKNEIKKLLPLFIEALAIVKRKNNIGLKINLHGLPHLEDYYHKFLYPNKLQINLLFDESTKQKELCLSNLALSASGSGTLKIAANSIPQIICYRLGLPSQLVYRKLMRIDYSNIINHFADKEIIPELLMEHCKLGNIVKLVSNYITDHKLAKKQLNAIEEFIPKLTKSSRILPGTLAARDILSRHD